MIRDEGEGAWWHIIKTRVSMLSACSHLFKKSKKYNSTATHKWPPPQSTLRNVTIYQDNYIKVKKSVQWKTWWVAERCPRPFANSQWSSSRLEGAARHERSRNEHTRETGRRTKVYSVSVSKSDSLLSLQQRLRREAQRRPAVGQRTRERFVKVIDHGEWWWWL